MQKNDTVLKVCSLFLVFAFGLQFLVAQWLENAALRREIRIVEKAKAIEEDQTRELMYQVNQLRLEKEMQETRHYVRGAVDAITKPDQYQAVWHAGYDRGAAVQKDADKLDNAAYTSQPE